VKVGGDFKPAGPSTAPGSPVVAAGLTATAPDGTFLRLERAAVERNGAAEPNVNWEARVSGRQQGVSEMKLTPEDKTIYLRLRRIKDRFFGGFSRDGTNWTEMPLQDVKMPANLKVGVAAVTTSAAAFQAKFQEFRLGDDGRTPVAPPPDQKTFAAKPPADWKGPQWVPTVDKMKATTKPAAGWVMGADFKPDEATLNPTVGLLTLRQGKQFGPGAYLTLQLGGPKTLAELEGKKLVVSGRQMGLGIILAQLSRAPDGQNTPYTQGFQEYVMKLEFGKEQGHKLPVTIYICFPDEAKSVIAGKFMLESK
jgi:hypothetical protein